MMAGGNRAILGTGAGTGGWFYYRKHFSLFQIKLPPHPHFLVIFSETVNDDKGGERGQVLLPEVVGGIIGSLPCHYPGAMLITGTPELLHPAWVGIGTGMYRVWHGIGAGYAGSAGLGKTLLPSLVIDASASTKHMFRKRSVDLLILTLKTMHCIAMIAGLLCWLLSLHIEIC